MEREGWDWHIAVLFILYEKISLRFQDAKLDSQIHSDIHSLFSKKQSHRYAYKSSSAL